MSKNNSKPKKQPITKRLVNTLLTNTYQKATENVIKAMHSQGVMPSEMQELIAHGKVNYPTVQMVQDGENVSINISVKGEVIQEEHIGSNEELAGIPSEVPKLADIRAHLDKHIIGQDEAKKVFARALKMHMERCFGDEGHNDTELQKQNVLGIGPSGCGKTEMWSVLSELTGVPVFIQDASALSPASYKGYTIKEMAWGMYANAGKDMEAAETSILVLDELDKLGNGVSSGNVKEARDSILNELLTFIEGGSIEIKESALSPGGIMFNTKNILVIGLGAFEGIEEMFAERGSIGFGAERLTTTVPNRNEIQDKIDLNVLKAWGFNSQFMGRFPIRTHIKELTEEELVRIQAEVPKSPLRQWQKYFEMLDQEAELDVKPEVLRYIASQAIKQKTGARELMSQYSTLLGEVYDEVESDENITSITVYMRQGKPVIQKGKAVKVFDTIFSIENEA